MRRLPLRSPPRVRGKVISSLQCDFLSGITPAYAGKRFAASFVRRCTRDHPRVCGEKQNSFQCSHTIRGSPPRMRGKGLIMALKKTYEGITPAYAGKSPPQARMPGLCRDHPRVCGEKGVEDVQDSPNLGSPPRVRGKGVVHVFVPEKLGITPAYAGKSARRQAGPPGPAPPPQMRLGWSPPPCTGRQCRTRKSTHARRARIPVPAHTPAPQ